MSKRIGLLSCLLAAVLCPSWAAAQVNYKSTMPDGKVIYGDKPVPGATKVDQLKAPPTKGIAAPTAKEDAALRDLEKSRATRDARERRISEAQQRLKNAEAALAAGQQQREGDRIGTAGGKSRVTEDYLERVKQLEADVAKARSDLAAVQASAQSTQRSGQTDPDAPPSARSKSWLQDK